MTETGTRAKRPLIFDPNKTTSLEPGSWQAAEDDEREGPVEGEEPVDAVDNDPTRTKMCPL